MKEIEILIQYILKKYEEINDSWKNDEKYYYLNMKTIKVENIYDNEELLVHIFNYRNFINENTINVMKDIQNLKFKNRVNTRVKALNSIQNKIEKFEKKKERGKISIKKCLNDIFGLRIIVEEKDIHENLTRFMQNSFPSLKCILAFRGDYKATHIYFGNDDNSKFQWELQIWNKEDEHTNLMSHAKYKQEYIKWEKENKQ